MKASVRFDHELLAVESEHGVHAMLEVVAPAAPETSSRVPLQLALVMDRSGSMSGDKLEVTKRCATYLARRLAPEDRLAVVAYDDSVELCAPLSPGDDPALSQAIDGILVGGTTNLSGGWLKGLEELGRAPADGPRKILLLTDGLANVGVTDPPTLCGMAERAAGEGVGTTTIGFGADFNEELLTGIATAGRGNAYFAPTPEEAPQIFGDEFAALNTLVAQNVSVEIRPDENVEVVGVLNEFPHTRVPGGVQIDLGDAYAEERRRVIFKLHIPSLARLGVTKVADVVLRYVTTGDEIASHEVTLPLRVNMVAADEAAANEPDAEVTDEVMILRSARARREARQLADAGNFDSAQARLRSTGDELNKWARHSNDPERMTTEARLLAEGGDQMTPGAWGPLPSKAQHFQSHQHLQGRHRPATTRSGRRASRRAAPSVDGLEVRPAPAVEKLLGPAPTDAPNDLLSRCKGALLATAAGTSLGLSVEGATAGQIRARYPGGVHDVPHTEGQAQWDDDLAQTAILAELLAGGAPLDPDELVSRLVRWGDENGRGMGGLTRAVLEHLKAGAPVDQAARAAWEMSGRSAAGNGAVMRCSPVALRWWREPESLVADAQKSALVTHHDPRCVWSVVAIDAVIALLLRKEEVDLDTLARALDDSAAPVEVGLHVRAVEGAHLEDLELDAPGVMGYTLKTMQVGLWCLGRDQSLEEVLIEVVNAGGDTDTNGAVAGAVLGAGAGEDAIPARWLDNVSESEQLLELADALHDASIGQI